MKKTTTEKRLGTIKSQIAGANFAEVGVVPGERLSYHREPDNPYDSNAIRLDNAGDIKVGYIPREMAHWMARLLDDAKIRLQARVPNVSGCDAMETLTRSGNGLVLKVWLTPEGAGIIKKLRRVSSKAQAVHEMVRSAYVSASRMDNPDAVRQLAEQVASLQSQDLLPETNLLISIFPSLADCSDRRRMRKIATGPAEFLASLKLADPLHYRNLTLFPILGANGHTPPYTLLETAIREKKAEVTEVSASGSVPNLLVRNLSSQPLLIPEGEILVGAKQNRVTNTTVIILAFSTMEIPVSCVEQGRWHHISQHFSADYYAPPNIRARKTQSVIMNRARSGEALSDQADVWDGVHEQLSKLGVHSVTDSVTAAYDSMSPRRDEYRKRLQIPKNAVGFLVAKGSRVIGADIFDCPSTLHRFWSRLSDAYFLEAAMEQKERAQTKPEVAKEFLDTVRRHIRPARGHIGAGMQIEVEGPNVVGSGIWFDGRLCHLSVFATANSAGT